MVFHYNLINFKYKKIMKFPLRFTLLTVAMMLLGFSARAGSISEEQAKAKVRSFLQARQHAPNGKYRAPALASDASLPLAYRMPFSLHGTSAGQTALYVFNVGQQGGFVIVSGDDRTRPILGYADSGSFDAGKMPAALREMLAIYARQIEMLGQGMAKTDSVVRRAKSSRRISSVMDDVEPLLTTAWDQGAPYNAYCPTLNDQTALTGCVATAMAQIANYHKFPTGQVPNLAAYTSATNKINVSAWGATTFDWNNMLDSYAGEFNNTQKTAVATLMRYCGQAAQMDYGFTSGAYNGDALNAFKEKLGYNANASFKSAASYSASGWEDLIYKEVSDHRPVYYSALNGDGSNGEVGGHAFVIDGYQADGNYFHVNWGWGGAANGYFNLFALDPGAPMSTATTTGWHYQMLAIVGLSPETVNTAKLMKDASGSWLITSADDWNELSANLEPYNGGTFKLTNDISVTTMVGTEDQPFSGTFDGQGHTLNVNIETDGWGAAPFNYVNSGTTIKNLKTQGTVTGYNVHASGLVGGTWNFDNFELTITNCEVAVRVNGDGHAGGFIGHAINMRPVFTDCIFSGSIYGCHDHGCFVGWKEWESYPVYINCLSIPTFLEGEHSCDFSHPGNGGWEDQATLTNCFYNNAIAYSLTQGTSATPIQLADGSVAHALQNGSREWTDGLAWGQLIGTDAVPVLTNDQNKRVNKVTFVLNGQVVKNIFTNNIVGDKMPEGEDFGLKNATFTCNGVPFTSTTQLSGDVTVTVAGTQAFTLTLGTPSNGTISINNTNCMPGTVKKVTAMPADGYVVSAVTVTDANGKALPVTQVSNNANEFVFVFPKSSVTVNAEFTAGEAEAVRFINGGMTLPLWGDGQPWTADTWTIWSNEYQPILGTPPADALGHQWYEESYVLTNSDADVQPNGKKIVWENHAAPFGNGRYYDYARACGAEGDGPNNFYMRRIFTFNTETVPAKLYFRCNYDDAPVQVYLNGTPIYINNNQDAGGYTTELTPEQIALIHTDGTPNVLAARCSQGDGDYYLDCGIYVPTVFSYEVTSENTVRVLRNEFITGDVVIPETVTYSGKTYTVTELADDVFNYCDYGLTSVCLPATITNMGYNAFEECPGLEFVKSYQPIYREEDMGVYYLVAAPADATEYEVSMGCTRIWNNAFKFTDKLKTLTLPRSLNYIGYTVFTGCTALTDIYSYARPVPQTEGNAFEGLDKSKITVHVYESALDSYKESWGEEFKYVTMPDPQPITLTVAVAEMGSLRSLIEAAATEKGSTIYDVVGITVTGNINQDDLCTLAEMCRGVYGLTTIDLSGVTIEGNYIGNDMFRDCEKLTSIILPETLEYINPSAFRYCNGLTSIDIPASVKRIAQWAFDCCENLSTVTGMEGLSECDSWNDWDPFYGTAITQPVYGGSVFLYMPPNVSGDFEMPAGIKKTAPGSIRNSQISSIILPASLTDLGNDTFENCRNLTDIYCYAATPPTCYDGVFGFDRGACTVHVPASAVEDYQNANEWRDMGRIVSIVASGDLVDLTINVAAAGTLNDELFEAAVAEAQISDKVLIRNLTVTGNLNADDVAYLNALPNTLYYMEQLDLSGATIENNAVTERMFYATGYKNIKLPAGITSIASEAFRGSRRLQEIMLPESLEYIGSHAFADCGLTSIVIPDGVTETEGRVLAGCHSLKSITIGNGMTYIPDSWAEGCTGLEELTIGKNMKSISWYNFRGGAQIKRVCCYSKIPPQWQNAYYDALAPDAVLHVYENCVKRYKSANGWNEFPTIVGDLGTYETYDLTVNVAEMGKFSEALAAAMTAAGCEDMMDISKLTVTGKVNSDDLYFIRDNIGGTLDKLDLGAVTVENDYTFGDHALAYCAFEELVLPESLERIEGEHAMEGCSNLKSIVIPNSVTYLGGCTLGGCTSLESVTLGKRVNYLGWRTFWGTHIKDIYCLAKNPPSWDNDVFVDGDYPEVLHVYSNYLERYQNADGWKNIPTIVGDLGAYPSYDLTVNVAEMGKFSEALAAAITIAGCEDMMDISKLTVTGKVNMDDLYYLRDNLGGTLDVLDLSAVKVENNILGHEALARCAFEEVLLPNTIEVLQGWHVLEGCSNLKTIYIPSSVTYVGPRTLNGAASLETVTGGENVVGMERGDGMYFDNCPNLKSPVILGDIMFRLPVGMTGHYVMPDHVTTIARDGMWRVTGLTAITLPESLTTIYANSFSDNVNLKDIYYYAVELPNVDNPFEGFDRSACTLHVYEEMVDVFKADGTWSEFNIVGDLGSMPVMIPMNESDYAALCTLNNNLNGGEWIRKWITNKNVQTASRWRGVTFDEDGYVTSIDLSNNRLSGDVSELSFSGLTKLKSLNLSSNALTGDIQSLAASLPKGCTLNVEQQELGYIGEYTLYEVCELTQEAGLPSIAYWRSDANTLASTLIGVGGVCQFYQKSTNGSDDWEGRIWPNSNTESWRTFSSPSPALVECSYPHHFTFTYNYEMGDANMDDVMNVLDLQSTLNYSNGNQWGLFNFHAADTYGQDDEINVQDIVKTVNILLEQENSNPDAARRLKVASQTEPEACVMVENGQLVLYTTRPVAALDLRIAGIEPAYISWNTEAMGFATVATAQNSGTHAIVYSLMPREMSESRTVLATFDARYTPRLVSAVLSDSKAQSVSVGTGVPTSISIAEREQGVQKEMYDLQGRKVDGQKRKGVYIERSAEGRLHKLRIKN